MVLVDTSVWVDVFRDVSGRAADRLRSVLQDQDVVLTRYNQLELLQGAADEREWSLLADYLISQDFLEMSAASWPAAARIYFDLRRQGATVRSPVDCCIAQLALEYDALLLHRDGDFEAIATVRPLRQQRH